MQLQVIDEHVTVARWALGKEGKNVLEGTFASDNGRHYKFKFEVEPFKEEEEG
jgi:hypothetical protein